MCPYPPRAGSTVYYVLIFLQDLAAYLRSLSRNESAYAAMLEYKVTREVNAEFRDLWLTRRPSWQCRISSFFARNASKRSWSNED